MIAGPNTLAAVIPPLLGAEEPPVVEIVNGESDALIFLTCDHASNRLPVRLGRLGLSEEDLTSHIGWDIGAADVARRLAERLDLPLILTGYSRLVIDCNRPPSAPDLIPVTSAGIDIPGNRNLSNDEKKQRYDSLFAPYHKAISELLDRRTTAGLPTTLLAIHSFTPNYPGEERPWHIDIACNRDRRLATILLERLSGATDLVVGDNLPYSVEDESDYTIPFHGERRVLPHALIEIRQDLLASAAGVGSWVERLHDLIRATSGAISELAAPTTKERTKQHNVLRHRT